MDYAHFMFFTILYRHKKRVELCALPNNNPQMLYNTDTEILIKNICRQSLGCMKTCKPVKTVSQNIFLFQKTLKVFVSTK